MPDVRVFVSATQLDLKDNCLTAVKAVFNRLKSAVSVDMGSWSASHDKPKDVCLEILRQDSTHYIGIFALRRGWVPEGDKDSITMLEFQTALEKYGEQRNRMGLFVPEEGSKIQRDLEELAGEQSEEARQAQEQFLNLIRQRGCNVFPDSSELQYRVEDLIRRWLDPGSICDLESSASIPASMRDIQRLGLDDQLYSLNRTLKKSPDTGLAFIIHGPMGYGHRSATEELAREIESRRTGELKCLVADLSDKQDGEGKLNIFQGLARCLDLDLKKLGDTEGALAQTIGVELFKHDVLIRIYNVESYKGGLNEFLSFWEHFVSAILPGNTNRNYDLITLFSHEESLGSEINEKPFVVCLPELEQIGQGDLSAWLRQWIEDKSRARELAAKIFKDTAGVPENTRDLLNDPDIWSSEAEAPDNHMKANSYDDGEGEGI